MQAPKVLRHLREDVIGQGTHALALKRRRIIRVNCLKYFPEWNSHAGAEAMEERIALNYLFPNQVTVTLAVGGSYGSISTSHLVCSECCGSTLGLWCRLNRVRKEAIKGHIDINDADDADDVAPQVAVVEWLASADPGGIHGRTVSEILLLG